MSDTPRPAAPNLGELVETANPALRPPGSDQTTLANVRPGAPTQPEFPLIAGYDIIEKVGEGGMGAVYRAKKLLLNREVALKTMRAEVAAAPGNRERFLREARAAAAVEHPNIVQIRHVDVAADGTPFIELEFLRGEPLDARMKREPVSPLDLILKVAREVSEGLAAAHAAELIHRDIKPANVWLEGDPKSVGQSFRQCKILDFGLARRAGTDDAELTAAGAILGTPAYMSPEQARGRTVDSRTDLFSLGIMLYRMATGAAPFTGVSSNDVMIAIINDAPPPLRPRAADLPPDLLGLIERLMNKAAADRPASAAEVAAEVAAIERRVAATNPESLVLPRGPVTAGGAVSGVSTAAFQPLLSDSAPAVPRSARDALTGLAAAVGLMPAGAAAFAGAWWAAAPWATEPHAGRLFVLATALAWAVALVSLLPGRAGALRWLRYAVQFAVGASIGALAVWADGWATPAGAAVTGVQYALYFGLAVCFGRWWWERLCSVIAGDGSAGGSTGLTWWRLLAAPLALAALVVVWPNQHAPLELAAVIVAAAVVAQAARKV